MITIDSTIYVLGVIFTYAFISKICHEDSKRFKKEMVVIGLCLIFPIFWAFILGRTLASYVKEEIENNDKL